MWIKRPDNNYIDLKTGHRITWQFKGDDPSAGAMIHVNFDGSEQEVLLDVPPGFEAAAHLEHSLKALERDLRDADGICDLSDFGRPRPVRVS
jgi:hypothetical protein